MAEAITILGAGLAGCEAAWQAARRGVAVRLFEMRPFRPTQAHVTDRCAELVCSNSMGSLLPDRALGLLKLELEDLDSLLIEVAKRHAVPAGQALAISREDFAEEITARIDAHPLVELVREEVTELPTGPTIIATGPLTSPALTGCIQTLTGQEKLYFYDAMAPIVDAESIDTTIAFRQNRRDEEQDGDYLNCPLDREQYQRFVTALLAAPRVPHERADKELERYFEGCMPIEVLAARGEDALAFGPMRPIGLRDPRTGRRPHAVVQLRQDDLAGTLYNMVGFQCNLRWKAQEEVLRLIPGLESARFVRLGQMHRNTFLNSPELLAPSLRFRAPVNGEERHDLYFAGQITGTEGYVGSTAGGLVAGLNLVRTLRGQDPLVFPRETMIGALLHYITHCEAKRFQPMKANMGLLPPPEGRVKGKRARAALTADRARTAFAAFVAEKGIAAAEAR